MRTRERTRLGIVAIAVMALSAAGGGGVAANGDSGAPVTLKLGTYNGSGSPTGAQIDEFAASVTTISNGDLTIEPQWELKSDDPTASLSGHVFDGLKDGSLDMIVMGARFFDQVGVTSFDALQTPFLIDSDGLMNAVASDADLSKQLLDGAAKGGMVGLALLPEGLRHLTSFKAPFLSLADLSGATVLSIPAELPDALIRALGATPSGLLGQERSDAIVSGSVDGIDYSYPWLLSGALGVMGTTTGNVTTYAGYNVIAVSQDAWNRLSDSQRDSLRNAAAATMEQLIASNPTDAALASAYCTAGGSVVLAGSSDVDALTGAAAPVTATLVADPVSKAAIDRIGALKEAAGPAAAPTACEPSAGSSPEPSGSLATLPPNGSYRAETTVQQLLDAGASIGYANDNAGVTTITFKDGMLALQWATDLHLCQAELTLKGDVIHLHWRSGCVGDVDFQWQPTADGIRTIPVRTGIPADRAGWDHVWQTVK